MSDNRSNNINLRVSLPEKKAIEKRARDRELSVSAFIRSKHFSDQGHQQRVNALKIKEPRLYALWFELNKQGNNLNQLAASVNGGRWSPAPEVIRTLKEARKTTENALLTLHDLIEEETVLMHRRGTRVRQLILHVRKMIFDFWHVEVWLLPYIRSSMQVYSC